MGLYKLPLALLLYLQNAFQGFLQQITSVEAVFFFWCLRYGQRQKRVKDTQAGSSPRCKAQDCALLEQADSRVASVDKKTLNHTREFNRA